MTDRVLIDSQAVADLDNLFDYIGVQNHSPAAAERLIRAITDKIHAYARQPLMGDIVDELGDDIRAFPYRRNYIVIYQPLDDGIRVLRVLHTARDWVKSFLAGDP